MDKIKNSPYRILVVDDDEPIRTGLAKLLSNHGYTVEVAHNGHMGLQVLQTGVFDLVITDILMPGGNGLNLITELKQIPNIKIIAISGGGRNRNSGFLKVAKSLGADKILEKPVSNDQYVESVNDLLNQEVHSEQH